ncbi:DeoR/GlpR transcriptional regulator [Nakamurella silvestris]|nr:DeoR/GlpR transcriptional regulator [Nakamurella silvestris]
MQRYERLNAILELLVEKNTLTVEEIAEAFAVSVATVRRDLDDLAGQQLVTRTRGGVTSQAVAYDLPLRYKSARQLDEKQRIAVAAAALVPIGSVVGLNGGTTATAVARALATNTDLRVDRAVAQTSLTVVTNAVNIASELTVRGHLKVVVVGGVARPQSYELIGPMTGRMLDDISMDIVVLGVDALSVADGAAAHHEGEAEVNALMVQRARRVVIAADASKLGNHAFARICRTADIDVLVTDTAADPEIVEQFRAAGVEVLVV